MEHLLWRVSVARRGCERWSGVENGGITYDGTDEGDEVVLQHGALHTSKISPLDVVLPILVPALLLQELEVRKTCPNDGK